MKKRNLILVIIGTIIILGFVIGGLWPESGTECTKMACHCDLQEVPLTEFPCNSCGVIDPIFVTGIFNIVRECSGREIVICEDYKDVGTRFDIGGSCDFKIRFLGFW